MKEKTEKELFEERYPASEVLRNPFMIASALGWLGCVKKHDPSAEWVDKRIAVFLVALIEYGVKVIRWELAINLMSLTIDEAMEIIDDALCFGFEFKVENNQIYWREACGLFTNC